MATSDFKQQSIGLASEPKKSTPVKKKSETLSNDNVQISDAAKLKADIKSITSHILSLLENKKLDKLDQIKEKLKTNFYNKSYILDKIADNLSNLFLGIGIQTDIIELLTEYLKQRGCWDIEQKVVPKWLHDFDYEIIEISAKCKAKNKKDIDKLRTDIFEKFSLGENGIMLEIYKG